MDSTIHTCRGPEWSPAANQRAIVLDIHGVCCDLVKGFLAWHELDPKAIMAKWPAGEYDLAAITGKRFEDLPFDFWHGLDHTPELPRIFEVIKDRHIILASKSCSRFCTLGTFTWVDKFFHGIPYLVCHDYKATYFDRTNYARTPILIDDSDKEIEEWGQPSILVPRHWNKGHGYDVVQEIIEQLALIDAYDHVEGYYR